MKTHDERARQCHSNHVLRTGLQGQRRFISMMLAITTNVIAGRDPAIHHRDRREREGHDS